MNSILHKNPFSLYDFLGYFFPGTLVLFIAIYLLNINNVYYFVQYNSEYSFIRIFIFIVFAYVLGHIISYLSSLTIERFSLWCYGYPSEFLLGQRKNTNFWNSNVTSSTTEKAKISIYLRIIKIIIKIIISIALLPISLFTLLSKLIFLESFITKSLDEFTINSILCKNVGLISKINLGKNYNPYLDVDYSRIMYHYYLHTNNAIFIQKTNNYVSLYGFLRSTALSLNILTITSLICCNNYYLTLILAAFTYIAFMSYMKFYRRYTLEIFMHLATDENIPVISYDKNIEIMINIKR